MASNAWAVAERQHWVITRSQLLRLGFSAEAVKHKVKAGRLHPIWRGVYAVGRPRPGRYGLWMAAVLACGPRAFLSHGSAAGLLEIVPGTPSPVDVSVPSRQGARTGRGIRVHRRRGLTDADVGQHLGIPVTSPALTLLDLAPSLSREQLERAIGEADKRDLIDPESLRRVLERFAGRPGVAALRETLDRHTFTLTDSELERHFLPLARQAGLSVPLTQQHVRDQAHAAAGLTPLRFTRAQVRFEPARVRSVLKAVAARL